MIISTLIITLAMCSTPFNNNSNNNDKGIRFTEMILADETRVPKPNIWEKNTKYIY